MIKGVFETEQFFSPTRHSLLCPKANDNTLQTFPFSDTTRYSAAAACYTEVTLHEFFSFERFYLLDRVNSSQREECVRAEPSISDGLCGGAHVNEKCAGQLGHLLRQGMVSPQFPFNEVLPFSR
jgi:hypothetical protein